MGPATLAAGAVVALLLLGLLVVLLRSRAETRRRLAAAQDETAALRHRLDELAARLEQPAPVAAPAASDTAYVITDAGTTSVEPVVTDRLLLGPTVSATVGEPLVKALALGHGVRRALSAESRHKIRFEMRRESRRTRKGRRREMKDAWRRERAREASRSTAEGTADGTAAPSADAA